MRILVLVCASFANVRLVRSFSRAYIHCVHAQETHIQRHFRALCSNVCHFCSTFPFPFPQHTFFLPTQVSHIQKYEKVTRSNSFYYWFTGPSSAPPPAPAPAPAVADEPSYSYAPPTYAPAPVYAYGQPAYAQPTYAYPQGYQVLCVRVLASVVLVGCQLRDTHTLLHSVGWLRERKRERERERDGA